MVRISRLTDYGVLLMSVMAARPREVHNAAEVAAEARLPLPTVSKLLRVLARQGLLVSHRGAKGGYSLAQAPDRITVASVIQALEGPIGLTLCAVESHGDCEHEPLCRVRRHWHKINRAIRTALEGITLSEMATPAVQALPATGIDLAGGADARAPYG